MSKPPSALTLCLSSAAWDLDFGSNSTLQWDFIAWGRETGMDRHAANYYPVMSDDALKGDTPHLRGEARASLSGLDPNCLGGGV